MDGDSGYLVPPDDVNHMAERIVTLVTDHIKSKEMGQAGRIITEAHSNQRFLE